MKTQLILYISIILFTLQSPLYPQARVTDLENLIVNHTQEDTIKVNLLNSLTEKLINNDIEKAQKYSDEALRISESLKYSPGNINALFFRGAIYYNLRKYQSALDNFQKALLLNQKFSNKNAIARIKDWIGNTYFQMNEIPKALEYYEDAKKLATEAGDSARLSSCLNNIGHLYFTQSDYDKAISYYNAAISIYEKTRDKNGLSYCLINIGNFYKDHGNFQISLEYFMRAMKILEDSDDKKGFAKVLLSLGNIHFELNDYDQAILNYNNALTIAENLDDKKIIARSLNSLGEVFNKQHKFSDALKFSVKALKLREEIDDMTGIALCYRNIGDIYYNSGDYNKSLEYFRKLQEIAEKLGNNSFLYSSYLNIGKVYFINGNYHGALDYTLLSLRIGNTLNELNNLKEVHKQLAEIYVKLNDYKKAYDQQVIFKQLDDSTLNEANIKKITTLELNYKFEKEMKTEELEQQKKDTILQHKTTIQKIVSFSLFLGIVLILILAIVAYRSFIQKRDANNILEKQKADIELQNRKLEELNATKDKFFSIIAHDLKTPFSTILGFSELLYNDVDKLDREELKTFIESIHRTSKNTYSLLEQLLVWARSQQGRIPYVPEKTDINDIVTGCLALVNNSAIKKQIKITNNIAEKLFVMVDKEMINTVIRNLLNNAIKYTNLKGEIKISAREQPDYLEITVADNGIGIEKTDLVKLFSTGSNKSREGTGGESGTGLGLLLCREFIEKHGGKIWAESEPGKGSDFKFTLPLFN